MDYIDGDTYYKIKYPDHNLVRTHAQYRLLQSMEEHYGDDVPTSWTGSRRNTANAYKRISRMRRFSKRGRGKQSWRHGK